VGLGACTAIVDPMVSTSPDDDGGAAVDAQPSYSFDDAFSLGLASGWSSLKADIYGACAVVVGRLDCSTTDTESNHYAFHELLLPNLTTFYVRLDLEVTNINGDLTSNFVGFLQLLSDNPEPVALNPAIEVRAVQNGSLELQVAGDQGPWVLASGTFVYKTNNRIDLEVERFDESAGLVRISVNGNPTGVLNDTAGAPLRRLRLGIPHQGSSGLCCNEVAFDSLRISTAPIPGDGL